MSLPVLYAALTPMERRVVREEYVRKQGGACAHCATPLAAKPAPTVAKASIDYRLFPFGFFKNPVHLHHDHITGFTIGAVHARCNAYLWQYHGE